MPRDHACLERFGAVFLRELEQQLQPRRQSRRRRRSEIPPPFKSLKEWLTWCEQDQQAELQEWQEVAWTLVEHYPRRAA